MKYRVAIANKRGNVYYLTTDEEVNFLQNCYTNHAKIFETKQSAEESIKNLPYPYTDKAVVVEVPNETAPVCVKFYYRIRKKSKFHLHNSWLTEQGFFVDKIQTNTKTYQSLEEAKSELSKLHKFNQLFSHVVKVFDYGRSHPFDELVVE